jgi:ankyrin repeat protein
LALREAFRSGEDLHSGIYGPWDYADEIFLHAFTRRILRLPTSSLEVYQHRDEEESRASLDTLDDLGYTPLHWACCLADRSAVVRLLQLGANPDLRVAGNCPPLYMLAWSVAPDEQTAPLIDILCRAGASTDFDPSSWYCPLRAAAETGKYLTSKALIANGADVNSVNPQGWTVMHAAAHFNQVDCLVLLYQTGAALPDDVLRGAILGDAREALVKLLGYKADHLSRVDESILHVAADKGSLEVLRILARFDLSGLDIQWKARGRTARELLKLKIDLTAEIEEAFDELERSILDPGFRRTVPEQAECKGEEELDIFYDAMEASS